MPIDELSQQRAESPRGLGQHRFFVVARNDDTQLKHGALPPSAARGAGRGGEVNDYSALTAKFHMKSTSSVAVT